MASNFNVTGLANYTKTNQEMLLMRAFFEPKTAGYMQKLTGVKSVIQLPNLSDVLVWQSGAACGLINPSGDTTIAARDLTVGRIKMEKQYCIADLETKYTQLLLKPGSNYEALPGGIDQALMENIMDNTGERVEKALWQSDTDKWEDYLNKFDGLIKIINAASGTTQANAADYIGTPVTAITSANVISVLQAVYNAMPISILDKSETKIFIGTDVSRLYQGALIAANLFHYAAPQDSLGEYTLHGTNMKIVPVPGLSGQNALYGLMTTNMFLGCDLENEEDEVKVWYSEDYDSVNMRAKFKLGVQIGIPGDVVKFTL